MKNMSKIFVFAMVVLLLASTVNCGYAQTKPELVMEVGTFHPRGSGDVAGLEYFKGIVEEKSEGRIKVNVIFGGTIGGEQDSVDQLRLGTLQMVTDGMGTMGRFTKRWSVWSLPYAYPDKETLLKSVDGPIGKAIKEEFERNGMIFVGLIPLGFRNMTTNRLVVEPADLKGMKLRLPENADWIKIWSQFGVRPVPIPAPEMFFALQTGTVDGQENPYTTTHVRKLWEVQDYTILTRHVVDFHITMLNKEFMDGLTEYQRELIMTAAQDMITWQANYVQTELMGKFRDEAIAHGMKEIEPNRDAFIKIARKGWEELRDQWDPWVYDQLISEISQ